MENTAPINEMNLGLQTLSNDDNAAEFAVQLDFKPRLKRRIFEGHELYASVRAYNVCKDNDLLTIEKLVEHYQLHKGFLHLKNIGLKTDEELIEICKLLLAHNAQSPADQLPITPKLAMTELQENYMDELATQQLAKLNIRSQNYLRHLFKKKFSFKKIFDTFLYNEEAIIPHLRNSGIKTHKEVMQFAKGLHMHFLQIEKLDDNSLKAHIFRQILKKLLGAEPKGAEMLVQSYFQGRPIFFQLLDYLLRNSPLLYKSRATIFLRFFTMTEHDETPNFSAVGDELGLTRERVRQLYHGHQDTILKFMDKLARHEEIAHQFSLYGWNSEDDLLMLADDQVQAINQAENVQFSQRFYTLVIWAFYRDRYKILSSKKPYLLRDYLVKADIYDSLDLEAILENTFLWIVSNKNEQKGPLLTELIQFGLPLNSLPPSRRMLNTCKSLLERVFHGLIQIEEGTGQIINCNYTYTPNIKLLLFDILQQANRPMNLKEICEILNPQLTPPRTPSTIASYLRRCKDLFIYFGRSSTYGLQQWETQKQGIKGGTIRSIVHEFLQQQHKPVHINYITAHVLRYRPNTNKENILGNIRLLPNKNYQRFKDSYYSLLSKKHQPLPIPPLIVQSRSLANRILRLVWNAGFLHVTDLLDQLSEKLGIPEEKIDQNLDQLLQQGKLHLSEDGILTPDYGNNT